MNMPDKAENDAEKNLADVLLNPVRMRIAQYLMLHQPSTTQEIGEHLSDVPKASLYRHLKKMTDCGLLKVVSENRVRGTVERVYALAEMKTEGSKADNEKLRKILQSTMLMLLGEFERYLSRKDADMLRDMFSMQTATLLLSDEEYVQFAKEISQVYARVLDNQPDGKRKMRRVTFIVSPVTAGHQKNNT